MVHAVNKSRSLLRGGGRSIPAGFYGKNDNLKQYMNNRIWHKNANLLINLTELIIMLTIY